MKKFFEILDNILEKMLFILLGVIVLAVFLQVIFRYILNAPLNWSEELAKLCFVWLIFLGAPLVTRDRLHIEVEYFMDKCPAQIRKKVNILMKIVAIGLFLIVAFNGFGFVTVQKGIRSVGLNIPMATFTWSVLIGMILLIIYTVAEVFKKENN